MSHGNLDVWKLGVVQGGVLISQLQVLRHITEQNIPTSIGKKLIRIEFHLSFL